MRSPSLVSYRYHYFTFTILTFVVVTMEGLRRQLDQDESRDASRGRTLPNTVTASHFMWDAFQIEEQQYVRSR